MLLVIPRSLQIYDWEFARWEKAYHIPREQLELDRPQSVLAGWVAQSQVPLCDLLPAFRQHAEAHSGDRLFYYPDSHMNAAGHRLTAEVLAGFIREKGLLPMRPKAPAAKSR